MNTKLILLMLHFSSITSFKNSPRRYLQTVTSPLFSTPIPTPTPTITPTTPISDVWQLDCYSRPVLQNKKKLWEVLITDTTGNLRVCVPLISSKVNSRELRKVVIDAMSTHSNRITSNNQSVKSIKFFRGAMFNMISIALNDLDGIVAKPSRSTYQLYDWLNEREENVYPR